MWELEHLTVQDLCVEEKKQLNNRHAGLTLIHIHKHKTTRIFFKRLQDGERPYLRECVIREANIEDRVNHEK